MNDNNEDEGFLALLKPIQDLTRNWEVDLSLHLDEYIMYIRQICGDKIPDMNFAQAAVLLQNSANIYSKKVDFLFTTVLQLLDALSKKHRLISGGSSSSDSPRKGRRTEAKNKEGGEEGGGANGPGRGRRKATVLDIEEFLPLDDICSDRCLTLDFEKEKQKQAEVKKPKIVLNAAIKVKAKDKTSNNIYNHKEEVMGKKEEFRLNWRMCSAGTLHQEFIISKNRFRSMEPVEISLIAPEAEASHHDDLAGAAVGDDWRGDDEPVCDGDGDGKALDEDGDIPPSSPPAFADSVLSNGPDGGHRESELKGLGENRLKKPDVIVDVPKVEWKSNDFNKNLVIKGLKKKKTTKVPDQLDEKKRKLANGYIITTFSIIDVLYFSCKVTSFNRALDFCYESKNANIYKRQLLIEHRKRYQAYLEKQARHDQVGDFKGFYSEEESDNENDFEGFAEVSHVEVAPEVEVPMPDKDEQVINESAAGHGWKADDPSSYDIEAQRTMQAFRSRKIDHNRMTDMARRVDEWHQKILPKLECAEQRSGFDVHEYGSKILENFGGKIGTVKKFEEIVGGKPREEVARYFLSTLMLANQYNLEISETEPGDLNTDCVQLKLLSTVRHHEELDDNLRHTSDKS